MPLHKQNFLCTTLIAIVLLSAMPAKAQDAFMFESGVFSNMMMQPNVDRMLKNNMRIARGNSWSETTETLAQQSPAKNISATGAWSRTIESGVISTLAGAYPAAHQASAREMFTQLLNGYRQIESQFSLPKNDTAGATAALLAGSYMAYHNADFPDAHFAALVNQLRGIITRNPDFARTTEAAKGEMYTQFAVLGMLTATTQMALKENPSHPAARQIEANMRAAGKNYLEDFLGVDASRVKLGARGIEVR